MSTNFQIITLSYLPVFSSITRLSYIIPQKNKTKTNKTQNLVKKIERNI